MYCPHCMALIDNETVRCPHCGGDPTVQNTAHALPVGTILSERYYVGAVIGNGGFGITYVGCDTKLNKKIAIKEYYPAGIANRMSEHSTNISITAGDSADLFEHEKQRFIKEAYLLAEFSGDRNIVNVTDILVEHNTAYFVMEYVEGETLESYIREKGRMSFTEALSLLDPMLDSLSVIHSKGLIHRDISPANIIVQSDRHVVLIDFGAAREYESDEEKSLSVILKHGYAPTEQYQSRGPQGPWTDVYAICATMYKMITGITPPSAIDRMVGDLLKKPSELGASISPSEEAALIRGLSTLQSDRFSSITDLRNAFREAPQPAAPRPAPKKRKKEETVYLFPEDRPQPPADYEPTEIVSPEEYGDLSRETAPSDDQTGRGSRRKLILITAVAAVSIVAIIGIIGWIRAGSDRSSSSEPTTEPVSQKADSKDTEADSTGTATADITAAAKSNGTLYKAKDTVNIRRGPSTEEDKISTLGAGDIFIGYECEDASWIRLYAGDTDGYIRAEFCENVQQSALGDAQPVSLTDQAFWDYISGEWTTAGTVVDGSSEMARRRYRFMNNRVYIYGDPSPYTAEYTSCVIRSIHSITRSDNGYTIRIDHNGGYTLRTNPEYPDTLDCFGTLDDRDLEANYSGSASITKAAEYRYNSHGISDAFPFSMDFLPYRHSGYHGSSLSGEEKIETKDGYAVRIPETNILACFTGGLAKDEDGYTDYSDCIRLEGTFSDFVNAPDDLTLRELVERGSVVTYEYTTPVDGYYASIDIDTDYDGSAEARLFVNIDPAQSEALSRDLRTILYWP